jgi:hypothetical protein
VTGLGPINVATGTIFRSANITTGNYAGAFVASPGVALLKGKATGLQDGWVGMNALATTAAWGNATLYASTSRAETDFELHCIAVGRWF